MSYTRRLSLSYRRIPPWNVVRKLACSSKRQDCLCKKGIGHLTYSCYQRVGYALPSWQ